MGYTRPTFSLGSLPSFMCYSRSSIGGRVTRTLVSKEVFSCKIVELLSVATVVMVDVDAAYAESYVPMGPMGGITCLKELVDTDLSVSMADGVFCDIARRAFVFAVRFGQRTSASTRYGGGLALPPFFQTTINI